jgi:predicted phage terminase large subunit-like protein
MHSFTQQDAARELIRRRRSRESLKFYAANIDIPGVPLRGDDLWGMDEQFKGVELPVAPHHILMLDALQRTMMRPNGRLMMFFPPGSAKSTYTSVVAPSWFLGNNPGSDLAVYSYASEIATKQSRRIRSIVRDPKYRTIFHGAHLSNEKGAADNWILSNGSSMMAAGLRAGITGNRLHGAIIDDPTKNREEADSEDVQSKNFEEYNDTVNSRLIPGAFLIIIQTLWSQLDIPMRLLPEGWSGESGLLDCQDGQQWEVICVPAKYEGPHPDPLGRKLGEYLWPQWFKPGYWDKYEKNPLARRTWSALCQQRPTPKEGLQFQRSMFKWYDPNKEAKDDGDESHLPATLHRYGASDYATLDDTKADFTEHGVAGMDWKGDLWFLDWWYGQKATDKGIEAFINIVRRNKPRRWANEGGPIDHAIKPAINRAMREANAFTLIESYPSIQAKGTKLMGFHARCAAGTVHMPKTEWAYRLVDQLCAFPAVGHDDGADVCGLIGRMLDKMAEAALPKAQDREIITPFTERWFTQGAEKPAGPKYTS